MGRHIGATRTARGEKPWRGARGKRGWEERGHGGNGGAGGVGEVRFGLGFREGWGRSVGSTMETFVCSDVEGVVAAEAGPLPPRKRCRSSVRAVGFWVALFALGGHDYALWYGIAHIVWVVSLADETNELRRLADSRAVRAGTQFVDYSIGEVVFLPTPVLRQSHPMPLEVPLARSTPTAQTPNRIHS